MRTRPETTLLHRERDQDRGGEPAVSHVKDRLSHGEDEECHLAGDEGCDEASVAAGRASQEIRPDLQETDNEHHDTEQTEYAGPEPWAEKDVVHEERSQRFLVAPFVEPDAD